MASTGIIVRAPRQAPVFPVVTGEYLVDDRLSVAALGMLVRIMASSDSAAIKDYRDLRGEFDRDDRALSDAWEELLAIGYVQEVPGIDASGQWTVEHLACDSPDRPRSA